jgi:hypothetical protein
MSHISCTFLSIIHVWGEGAVRINNYRKRYNKGVNRKRTKGSLYTTKRVVKILAELMVHLSTVGRG